MKFVSKASAEEHPNSPTCTVFEYEMADPDLNGAVARINGRYPEKGFAMNHDSKELVYVLAGQGRLTNQDGSAHDLREGDMALIEPNEKYFFEGQKLELLLPCAPAWHPGQYEEVAE